MSDEQSVAEVRSVMYRMAERYGAGDVDGVMAIFIDDGPANIGTGVDEVRFGVAEVRRQIARDASEAENLSMSMENLRVKVFGDAAFAYSDVVFTATVAGERRSYPARTTVGLTRKDAGWQIVQIHTSFPYGGQSTGQSWPVELTDTLSDLLTSIGSESDAEISKTGRLGTATVLFTDVVDSTKLSQSMGDERWTHLISRHFEMTGDIVEAESGSVVKTLGDGAMYVFPSATAALRASVRVQREATESIDERLQLRIGVHTGDVIEGHNDYLGLTVNKAARVAAAAAGGQILVSSSTVDSVNSSEFEFENEMTFDLKGIAGTHTLQPLRWHA